MNETYRCDRCDQPLAQADAICAHCEAELSHETHHAQGAHPCPACHARFDQPLQVLCPRAAPWHAPRQFKPSCPHCAVILNDQLYPKLSTRHTLILMAFAIGLWSLSPNWMLKPILIALLAWHLAAHVIRARRLRLQSNGLRFSIDADEINR